MLHSQNCSLQPEKEGSVILFMFLELMAGVDDDIVFALVIGLGKDGTESSFLGVVVWAGTGDPPLF